MFHRLSKQQAVVSCFIKTALLVTLLTLSACGSEQSDEQEQAAGQTSTQSDVDDGSTASALAPNEPALSENNTETVQPAATLPFSKVETHMILGTGSVQGAYFPIGGVICRLLNRDKTVHNLRCSVESTAGSVYNLRELREGNFGLVVSQSDWQYHAYNGTSTFEKDGPNNELRAVFALEADPIVLIVKADSEIEKFEDLQDRLVSFGYTRSLQHRIVNDYLEALGWSDDNFKDIVRISDPKQINGLCEGDVEAILFLMSSLDDYLRDLNESCKLKMIPLEGDPVKQVITDKPYYRIGIIPAGRYLNSTQDIPSFGLGAVFVASDATSIKAIYNIVKEVVENFKDFKSLHPSLATMELTDMPYAGIAIPLHPGAISFYREARLLR